MAILKTMQLPRFRPREDEVGHYLLVLTDGRNAVFLKEGGEGGGGGSHEENWVEVCLKI